MARPKTANDIRIIIKAIWAPDRSETHTAHKLII
ncbi:uncharacterized protein METZ01_LOCUS51843 [marine metagenome]|uniref:Uncharacterized protein n=1 Tax=marine metagenome TaxID=408172 RepID=A0A381S679_9ZZZZ